LKYMLSWTHHEGSHRTINQKLFNDIADALHHYEYLLTDEYCTLIRLCAILEESK